ncbi:large subunit ribosomal protein L23 [Oceanospirillum multiglobuliferum]|uniref:Large ribosomal subunit protein uL23 n=1 Tax=Oceanospirillum multiglobuliferum TaxID=64969 RepID=A0A1T4RMP0_9GAMM|nr:50S ribosomal protein L23 [Oceanospirillum multiglobuliferum]OPX54730.1 50S ribosomal protein L23 [Oceanospirillum multiglobuliferum]SKA17008.1 large subunit ribosomal protein L23 [Oceanospirillum multiglobuliferum]
MNQERVFKVLLGPHISEKAAIIADESNQYVFKVAADATKPEIKKAVEQLFEVTVTGVSTVNVKGKTKRTARGIGRRKGFRKAYVSIAEGQEIDFAGAE